MTRKTHHSRDLPPDAGGRGVSGRHIGADVDCGTLATHRGDELGNAAVFADGFADGRGSDQDCSLIQIVATARPKVRKILDTTRWGVPR